MSYFAVIAGKQEGPFTEDEIRQKLGGTIDSQTLIWKEGMENWLPLELALPTLSSVAAHPPSAWVLAPRASRFLAMLVDVSPVFIIAIVAAVLVPLAGSKASTEEGAPIGVILLVGVAVLLCLALAVVQIVMLVKFSQSIGKRVLKIRIYDNQTRQPANWVKTIVMRMIVNGVPSGLPFVGGIYALVDILFIFREDRRCIHDLIAGTVVGTVPEGNEVVRLGNLK